MKVLVFEQWHGGHYDNYLACLLPQLATLAEEVVVAVTPRFMASPQSPARQADIAALGNVAFQPSVPEISPRLPARDRYRAAMNLVDAMRAGRPDYTLVPSCDAQSWVLAGLQSLGRDALRGLGPVEATFHTGYGPSLVTAKQRLKELVYGRIYRQLRLARMNFVNFNYYEYLQARGRGGRPEIRLVGDPVPVVRPIGREAACRLLGIEPRGRTLGLLGSLDRRKAIPELLAAFSSARLKEGDRLLLGGRLAPEFATLVRERYASLLTSGRLVLLDRFLSDDELQHGFEALDLVAPVYYDFPGLASLALKALAAGRPVLVGDLGWSRSLVRRFEVGQRVDLRDGAAFARAIENGLDAAADYRPGEAVERLLAFHAVDNFADHMLEGVALHGGRTPLRARLDWPWVLEALPAGRRHLR
jgi:glycosyltransferase involved in cell wall biosynthesis